MSQVVNQLFVDEKSDAALDSGVCPSPDENYQSYFDAFPALSSCGTAKNLNFSQLFDCTNSSSFHQPPTSPPAWFNFSKYDDISEIPSKAQLRFKSFSSSPTSVRPVASSPFLPSIRNSCSSAPSPTYNGATPNKRQKLSDALRAAPDQVTELTAEQHQHSCPELLIDAPGLFYQSPEFCCPQVTNLLAASTPFNGGLPPTNGASSLGASPQFVVPKCFKVGSWPGGKMSKRPAASDVPLWACGQWFCTLHKSLQLGLLSAKVQTQAAKIFTPPQSGVSNFDVDVLPYLDANANDVINDDDVIVGDCRGRYDDVGRGGIDDYGGVFGYASDDKDFVEDYCSIDVVVDNFNDADDDVENDASMYADVDVFDVGGVVDDDVERPNADVASAEFFDAPQFILHLINSDADNDDLPGPKDNTALFPKSNASSSWPNAQFQNANLALDTSCFWPDVSFEDQLGNSNNAVPEFDIQFPPVDNSIDNINLAVSNSNLAFVDHGQEVGFCLPKLDVRGKTGAARSRALAVPISPDTHFVPIKSESMEDAYFLKPGFDDSCLKAFLGKDQSNKACRAGVAYLAESDYYVYLEQPEQVEVAAPVRVDKSTSAASNKSRLMQQNAVLSTSLQSSQSCNFEPNSFNSLPLKFRASKPGKMVQTEEKYFDRIKNEKMAKIQEKFFKALRNNDAKDFLVFGGDRSTFDVAAHNFRSVDSSRIAATAASDDDNRDAELRDRDFEIWACRSMPLTGSYLCHQLGWNNGGCEGSASVCEPSSQNDPNRQAYWLSTNGDNSLKIKEMGNKAEMELWQKQDERDEELLLKFVSNISLISPLEMTACGDGSDQ